MKKTNRIISTLLAVVLALGAVMSLAAVEVSAAETKAPARDIAIAEYITTEYPTAEARVDNMTLMLARSHYELYVDKKSGEAAVKDTETGDILLTNPYDVATSKKASDGTKQELLSQIIVQYLDNGQSKSMCSFSEASLRDQVSVRKIKNGVRVEYTIGNEDNRKLVPKLILDKSFQKFILKPFVEGFTKDHPDYKEDTQAEYEYDKFTKGWTKLCVEDFSAKATKNMWIAKYPVLGEQYLGEDGEMHYNTLWLFREDDLKTDIPWFEERIKLYCDDYTFEQMDADHEEAGYVTDDEKFPVFKMALEYSLDDTGMTVSLPCNGLRYDMSAYTLESISILPYIGAANNKNSGFKYTEKDADGNTVIKTTEGYNFYPDGAGSLFDFDQLNTNSVTGVQGKVYGLDYAYHAISGVTYQKTIRYPVYGSVASEVLYKYSAIASDKDGFTTYSDNYVSNTVKGKDEIKEAISNLEVSKIYVPAVLEAETPHKDGLTLLSIDETKVYHRGYVAIIEEGEAFAEIQTYHAGAQSEYNSMRNYFNPKAKDTYDLSDSISVTSSSMLTIVSNRKYTGNLSIRYLMLCDEDHILKDDSIPAENAERHIGYDTSWLGMAEAYRDYLCTAGTLKQLTAADVEKDIPLYIESFGALETQDTFMTIPVTVMTPMTTFEDIWTMYSELSEHGINNVNFKMTGFANGGMQYTVPNGVDWEKSVGGSEGFKKLVSQANEINSAMGDKHLGLYPDFDFAYIQNTGMFDGVSLKKDAVKTVDNRYTSFRQYSATLQDYVTFYQLALSPSRYSKFYTRMLEEYADYDIRTLSVASLGNTLNSDFDEDEPFSRVDDQGFTAEALEYMNEQGYSLMTDSGNAFTWAYVDHILNVSLDSSRYVKSSASVPFIGAVLHGYIRFAGTPINKEGDTDYAMLRAIENGAGLYFVLSYQNTNKLKEDELLSQNYSVDYKIWLDDVIKYYDELNTILKDVQTLPIVDHEFLVGERVLDLDELQSDIAEKLEKAELAEDDVQANKDNKKIMGVADAWITTQNAQKRLRDIKTQLDTLNSDMSSFLTQIWNKYNSLLDDSLVENTLKALQAKAGVQDKIDLLEVKREELKTLKAAPEPDDDAVKALEKEISDLEGVVKEPIAEYDNALEKLVDALSSIKTMSVEVMVWRAEGEELYKNVSTILSDIDDAIKIVTETPLYNDNEDVRARLIGTMNNAKAEALSVLESVDEAYNAYVYCKVERNGRKLEVNYLLDDPEYRYNFVKLVFSRLDSLFIQNFQSGKSYSKYVSYKKQLLEDLGENYFTQEQLFAMVAQRLKKEDVVIDEESEEINHYLVDNNQIVAVTYGTRDMDTHEKIAYKTFILNYNTFAVRVVYNNKTYTIASGDYVMVMRDAN